VDAEGRSLTTSARSGAGLHRQPGGADRSQRQRRTEPGVTSCLPERSWRLAVAGHRRGRRSSGESMGADCPLDRDRKNAAALCCRRHQSLLKTRQPLITPLKLKPWRQCPPVSPSKRGVGLAFAESDGRGTRGARVRSPARKSERRDRCDASALAPKHLLPKWAVE